MEAVMTQEKESVRDFDIDSVFEVEDYMYFYGDLLTDETTQRQVAFLVRELELALQMKILDLACGFGRHANRLAALGFRVEGIDYMPGFLEMARKDAQARGVLVDYRQGDMRQIDFNEVYDRVLLLFTAFGYFEDDQNFMVLRNIARALQPGGLLVFDIHNRDVFLNGFRPDIVTEKEGNLMIDRNRFDTTTGRLYNRRIIIRNGVRRDKPFFVRMYNPNEITELVRQAGLQVVKMFGGWDSQPLSIDARRMIVVACKGGAGHL
jgi:SAM-dependent methyltransferase